MNKTPSQMMNYFSDAVIPNVTSCQFVPCKSAQAFWVGVLIGLLIALVAGLVAYMIIMVERRQKEKEAEDSEDDS